MTRKVPVQIINDWPGSGDSGMREVPTTLIYNPNGTISSWGFMCNDEEDNLGSKVRRECFKLFLDDKTLEKALASGLANVPRSTLEAQKCTTDYLREVYSHVKETIETQIGKRDSGVGQHGGRFHLQRARGVANPGNYQHVSTRYLRFWVRDRGVATHGQD
jgi:hypothetical protein